MPADRATRIECVHAETCGGCPAIGASYGAQLTRKAARLADARTRFAELAGTPIADVAEAASITGYRTRAKLAVSAPAKLGIFRPGAHDVVDIPECRVLAPVLAEAAVALRAMLRDPPAAAGAVLRPTEHGGALRAVDLREVCDDGTARALATLVLDARVKVTDACIEAAADSWMARVGSLLGVAVSFHDGRSPQVLGRDLRVVRGPTAVHDQSAADEPFVLATHGAFAQAHRGQAVAIRRRVRDALEASGTRRVLELYAGAGALGLALARDGLDVTLVDSFAPSLEKVRDAASEQRLEVRAVAADATQALGSIARRGDAFESVVVNPPRRGLAPAVRDAIADLSPRIVAYVSCDPETLCRDLAAFARRGLATRELAPFDMIPLTDEVETLALLVPGPVPPPRVLWSDDDVVVVDKDPHEPTTPQGERPTALLDRVRRLDGCADAVPVHRLDDGTSGVCIFARRPGAVSAWASALGADDAVKQYVALCRGLVRDKGSITRPLLERGRSLEARTRYRLERLVHGHSLLRVEPDQGRRHQIRRHLAAIGHPILGDARYGHAPSNRHFIERWALDRPFLHCARIELAHPGRGTRISIESPLAGDLAIVLARLDAHGTRHGDARPAEA